MGTVKHIEGTVKHIENVADFISMPMSYIAPSPAAPKLSIRDLRLVYTGKNGKSTIALNNVSLDVPDRKFVVVVGPSGCGKSSLLYLAAGLSEPTSGVIEIDGAEVSGPGPDRGMVFQSYTLFPWLTVRENVEFGLRRRRVPDAEREDIVNHFLNEIGLSEFHDSYATQLSGGMKQRVAIARALANSPEILLMDEPFGALDSQTRLTMQKLLLKIWEKEKTTVMFVTHDVDEAILLADQIYVMTGRPGRIKEQIEISIERPRTLDMVLDPEFIQIKRQILELLHVK